MLVFVRHRLVLLSVPKTGTTALETALAEDADMVLRNPPHLKHTSLQGWQKTFAPLFQQDRGAAFRSIAVVRDPVDRLRSWYRYRHRDGLIGQPNSTRGLSFEAFAAEVMRRGPRAPFARIGTQSDFLTGKDGAPADLLYAYEDLDALTTWLGKLLGRAIRLPRLNSSPPVETPLSAETEQALRDHLAADCALHRRARAQAVR